jgi:pimeloyl-ACP methyl ester carboxylesterase
MVETPRQAERVLFLPGASGDREFWKPVADRVQHSGDKVLLGWPGFGSNPEDPSIKSLDDLFQSVLLLIDRPVDLVAQSMGGVLAVRAALKAPELVRHLVLTATSGGIDVSRFGAADWREQDRRNRPAAPDWFARDRSDFSPRLSEVKAPALLIWSDADPISPLAVGRYLVAMLPRAELVVLHGTDHMFARDRAEEIAPRIERHLLAP